MNKYADKNQKFLTEPHNYFIGFLGNGDIVYFISSYLNVANKLCNRLAKSVNTTCTHVQETDSYHAKFCGLEYINPGDEKKIIYHDYSLDNNINLDYNTRIIMVE